MPISRFSLGALVLAVALSTGPGCSEEARDPLEVAPARHDFGEVLHGDHPKHTFRIENTTAEPIMMTLAKPTCICFKVTRKPRMRLDPGESTEMEITLESDVVPPQRLRGKYIEIRTDHATHQAIHVPLEGTIFSPLYTVPKERLVFGMVTGEPGSRSYEPKTIEIHPEREYRIELNKDMPDWPKGYRVSQPQWFDVETEQTDDGTIRFTVTLKDDAKAPAGRFGANLSVALKLRGPRIPDVEEKIRSFRLEGIFPN